MSAALVLGSDVGDAQLLAPHLAQLKDYQSPSPGRTWYWVKTVPKEGEGRLFGDDNSGNLAEKVELELSTRPADWKPAFFAVITHSSGKSVLRGPFETSVEARAAYSPANEEGEWKRVHVFVCEKKE